MRRWRSAGDPPARKGRPASVPSLLVPVAIAALVCACAGTLPDQDRRITVSPPAYKLSADILWTEYQADRAAADKKYWGKVIEITGRVTNVEPEAPARLVFEQESPLGVVAFLLDDRAPDVLGAAEPGARMTLRCYCAGLTDNLTLKSCILPQPE